MIRIDGLPVNNNNGEKTKNHENRLPSANTIIKLTTTFDTALWGRIQAFTFDPPQLNQHDAKLTFAIRLARETGWTPAFADQAIQEYRRFLYLAVRAGHPVTPSQEVDEVWHLHLMYTRHYWGVLCRDVLQTDLHHGPSLGGASEHAKYHDLYRRTLDSYTRIFGASPPAAFWPAAAQRFRPQPRMGSVDPATHWIIRKPSWPRWRGRNRDINPLRGLVLFCVTALALGAPPIASSWAASSGHRSERHIVVFLLSLLGVYALFAVVRFLTETPAERTARKQREAERRQNSSGGCGGDSGSGCGGGCGGGCS
jgi:hypothetical protein